MHKTNNFIRRLTWFFVFRKEIKRFCSSKKYLLITKDEVGDWVINSVMDTKDIIRITTFLSNFYKESDAAVDEVNDILNQKF